MKKLLKIGIAVLLAYGLVVVGFYVAMRQKPGTFSKVMSHTPDAAFIVLPFKSMWLNARKGSLRPVTLRRISGSRNIAKTSKVRLSSFRGQKPVVLVFGSYT
jgi:hypothetical protein